MDNNTTTNFSDVFKDNFLSGFSLSTQNLTLPNVLISLGIAFLLGMVIYFIYKKTYRGVLYSHSFNLSLIMLSMVTTLVIMCISSAPALSLGMVGALSIVRFRTAVKDPLDTAYMFWALTMGILLGAGQFLLTAVAGVAIAVLITLVCKWRVKNQNCYLLVLRMNEAAEKPAAQVVNGIRFQRLRTKTVMQGAIEATYEVRLDKTEPVLKRLHDIPGMQDATLVAYTGEGA